MMGVYIKGVEMPKDGEHPCWVTIHSDGTVEYNENKGQGWQTSEAVPVPPPETSEPTIYERQILTNQAVIMGALAELMPNEGADQLLENMYVSALQTMKILNEADKEKEA